MALSISSKEQRWDFCSDQVVLEVQKVLEGVEELLLDAVHKGLRAAMFGVLQENVVASSSPAEDTVGKAGFWENVCRCKSSYVNQLLRYNIFRASEI